MLTIYRRHKKSCGHRNEGGSTGAAAAPSGLTGRSQAKKSAGLSANKLGEGAEINPRLGSYCQRTGAGFFCLAGAGHGQLHRRRGSPRAQRSNRLQIQTAFQRAEGLRRVSGNKIREGMRHGRAQRFPRRVETGTTRIAQEARTAQGPSWASSKREKGLTATRRAT